MGPVDGPAVSGAPDGQQLAREADARVSAEEAALIARVQRGEREAFDVLARRYARRAFAVAYRILRHQQDAEDLVQEAFIAALTCIASFDPARPFAPWFFRIVVNRAVNAVKSRAARERYVRMTDTVDSGATVGGADAAERAEIRERVREALLALPQPQRLIVELVDIDGRSSAEIGDMLDMPRGTVRWHLHAARAKLRAALATLYRTDT